MTGRVQALAEYACSACGTARPLAGAGICRPCCEAAGPHDMRGGTCVDCGASGRVRSPLTTEQDRRGGWSWFCHETDCGHSGMSCPSESFARREGERHLARDHA